jgi:hypothetical protein
MYYSSSRSAGKSTVGGRARTAFVLFGTSYLDETQAASSLSQMPIAIYLGPVQHACSPESERRKDRVRI